MKNIQTYVFVVAVLFCSQLKAQGGTWAMMSGSITPNLQPVPGVMGVPGTGNTPGASFQDPSWVDAQGNFWLLGPGLSNGGAYSYLWKFDPYTLTWTWVNGNANWNPVIGALGVESAANTPGSRQGAATWVDNNGNLWLYGGNQQDEAGGSDMWKYDIVTQQWAWMGGDTLFGRLPIYGTYQVASSANHPGSREYCSTWADDENNLWLFGGYYLDSISPTNVYSNCNDVWKYNIATNKWAWMKGPPSSNPSPYSYGVRGVESPSNLPPARVSGSEWKDASGNFYLFAGAIAMPENGTNTSPTYSDVWKFSPFTNNWTWISGDSFTNYAGNYLSYCTDVGYKGPAARWDYSTAQHINCNTIFLAFGGGTAFHKGSEINDLWYFDITSNHWRWVSGSGNGLSGTNLPAPRRGQYSWMDTTGVFWLFGGTSQEEHSSLSDVWNFTLDTSCLQLPVTSGISYQLSGNAICKGDSVILALSNITGAHITPTINTTRLDSLHILLYPDSSTSYLITGSSSCRANDSTTARLQILTPHVNILSDNNNICPGDSALLCAPDGFTSYLWSNGQTGSCFYTTTAATYTVSITESNHCSAVSNPITVTLLHPSPVEITIAGNVLTAYNDVSYQWYLNGNLITGATNAVYVAQVSGQYSVTVVDSGGCLLSSTAQNITVTGLAQLDESRLHVYPNPLVAGNWLLVADPSLIGSNMVIYDEQGRSVYQSIITGNKAEVSQQFAPGVYLLHIEGSSGNIMRKLVKL